GRSRRVRQAAAKRGRRGRLDRTGGAVARGRVPRSGRAGSVRVKKALAVATKEFRQIVRDRRTLMILLFVPAFFLLLYGYALNWDIRHVRIAGDDRDRSEESRSVVSAFTNSGYFDLVTSIDDRGIAPAMNDNDVRAVIVLPSGFSRALQTGRAAEVQVLINGDNSNSATAILG